MAALDDETLGRLRGAIARVRSLRLAVLFGSQASGQARDDSDVDIGVVPVDAGFALADELRLASALSAVVGREVNLVRLDVDNPLLGREVARAGVCLFEQAPGAFAAYRAAAMSCWIDFDETVAPHRERFLRRLAGARS